MLFFETTGRLGTANRVTPRVRGRPDDLGCLDMSDKVPAASSRLREFENPGGEHQSQESAHSQRKTALWRAARMNNNRSIHPVSCIGRWVACSTLRWSLERDQPSPVCARSLGVAMAVTAASPCSTIRAARANQLVSPPLMRELVPSRAGIDPLNKLIDRNGDDNEMDVSR